MGLIRIFSKWLPALLFRGSREYWERRYALGGDSGAGSYGEAARYKAAVLNAFVEQHGIRSVMEFGCGDGHQLSLARYPAYVGLDVSDTAIARCRAAFDSDPTKSFLPVGEYAGESAQLVLSLDVLFHLVEDAVYQEYLQQVFGAASEYVILYTTSTKEPLRTMRHVRHRPVEHDVATLFPQFQRMREVDEQLLPPPGEGAEVARFFFYRKTVSE